MNGKFWIGWVCLGVWLGLGEVVGSAWSHGAGPPTGWRVLEGCVLVPWSGNDGDSFKVRHRDSEFVVRLYWVDAPEESAAYPDRLADQAAYFGIEVDAVVGLGDSATQLAKRALSRPFTIYTQWAPGGGWGVRYLAHVETAEGPLDVLLVGAGLARIHGFRMDSPWPGGPSLRQVRERLAAAERSAQQAGFGGWGGRAFPGGLTEPAAEVAPLGAGLQLPSLPGLGRRGQGGREDAAASGAAPQAKGGDETSVGTRVNLNRATTFELETLPGIGPRYAAEIVAGRPWGGVEELVQIRGIGPQAVARLRPMVTADEGTDSEHSPIEATPESPLTPGDGETAAFYRADPERWRGQRIRLAVWALELREMNAPDGFTALWAETGKQGRGGRIGLFAPTERVERARQIFAEAPGPIAVEGIFYDHHGEDVVVIGR